MNPDKIIASLRKRCHVSIGRVHKFGKDVTVVVWEDLEIILRRILEEKTKKGIEK